MQTKNVAKKLASMAIATALCFSMALTAYAEEVAPVSSLPEEISAAESSSVSAESTPAEEMPVQSETPPVAEPTPESAAADTALPAPPAIAPAEEATVQPAEDGEEPLSDESGLLVKLGDGSPATEGENYTLGAVDKLITILKNGAYQIAMETPGGTSYESRITVKAGLQVDLTLTNVKIDVSGINNACALDVTGANATLFIEGENSLVSSDYRAGIEVPVGAALIIDEVSGSTEAECMLTVSGSFGAAIGGGYGNTNGGNCGSVTINSGTVDASGSNGAGIGGGYGAVEKGGAGGIVTINGGIVSAVSISGAGIGGGYGGYTGGVGGTLTINGGVVTANGYEGAGIGGGYSGNIGGAGGSVTINGGKVDTYGGSAAGIGGGYGNNIGGAGGTVTINGGTIAAVSPDAAGIGGGHGRATDGAAGKTILLGSSLTAEGSSTMGAVQAPPVNAEGKTLYQTYITIGETPMAGNEAVTGGSIAGTPCDAQNIPPVGYGIQDVYTDEDGRISMWLPATATPELISLTVADVAYGNTFSRSTSNGDAATLYEAPVINITNTETELTVLQGATEDNTLQVDATISPVSELVYTITLKGSTELPTWITIDSSTGLLTALPTMLTAAGRTEITVTASHPYSAVSKDFSVIVSDITPPELIAGSVTRMDAENATAAFMVNEPGEYFYAVVDKDEPAPTMDTSGSGTVCTTGKQTIQLTGLTAGEKELYIVAKDTAGNTSTEPLKMLIPDVPPPTTFSFFIEALTGGSITVGSAGEHSQGTRINISATAQDGYEFAGWSSSNGGGFANAASAETVFVMPGNATTVTAAFNPIVKPEPKPEPKPVAKKITLSMGAKVLKPKQVVTLKPIIEPTAANKNKIVWSSSKPYVATVSSSGKVTAKATGTTIITAKVDGRQAKCEIRVNKTAMPVTSIKLSKSTVTIKKGKSEQLTATLSPKQPTINKVTWLSSDTKVATVKNGKILAVGKGKCKITVSSVEGGKVKTCWVTVK